MLKMYLKKYKWLFKVMCFVFVFAALLEYAAVNYSYWGRRSRGREAQVNISHAHLAFFQWDENMMKLCSFLLCSSFLVYVKTEFFLFLSKKVGR